MRKYSITSVEIHIHDKSKKRVALQTKGEPEHFKLSVIVYGSVVLNSRFLHQ